MSVLETVVPVSTRASAESAWLGLTYLRLELRARAEGPIDFGPGRSALRGSLGNYLPLFVVDQATSQALLAPQASQELAPQRGSDDASPPYVLVPDTRTEVPLGEEFSIGLRLFGSAAEHWSAFLRAFERIGEVGLGERRGQFTILKAEQFRGAEPYPLTEALLLQRLGDVVPASLPEHLRVRILSPLRVKFKNDFIKELPFHVLIRALARRVNLMAQLHGGCGQTDFTEKIGEADRITCVRSELSWREDRRYSSRQRRSVPMGGLLGSATYRGDFAPFRELLGAGRVLHVGKNATFGFGAYALEMVDLGDL